MSDVYYAIRKTNQISDSGRAYDIYEVAKFQDGEPQPRSIYDVEINRGTGKGTCNCPAGLYRKAGNEDKHVKMVKKWIADGCPQPAIVEV